MLKLLIFSSVVLAQDPQIQCNSTACPYPDDWKAVVQVSEISNIIHLYLNSNIGFNIYS